MDWSIDNHYATCATQLKPWVYPVIMATSEAKAPAEAKSRDSAEDILEPSPAGRVAAIYFIAGLMWIFITDLILAGSEKLGTAVILASILKGSVFVSLSTILVYWLSWREFAKSARAKALLRAVVEGTTDAVFVKDHCGRYLLVNTAATRFVGRSVDEILGRDDSELLGVDEATPLMESDRTIMHGGKVITLEETVKSLGVTRTYQSTKAPFVNNQGIVIGLLGISRDITSAKRFENELREKDLRLLDAHRIARIGSWGWEPPTNRVWWSDAEFELFGIDPTQVSPSFETFLSLLHPDDRPVAIARVESMLGGVDEFADDLRLRREDGNYMWIRSQARAIRDEKGGLVRVEGTDQDITVERQAREAIRESERRLHAAVEIAELGVTNVDYFDQTVSLSRRAAEQFGFPPDTTISRSEFHARFHPDDEIELAIQIENACNPSGSGWFSKELRVVRPDGTVRWLNVRKQVTLVDGRPQGAVIVTADVTERRNSEALYREQEMLLREAAELAKVGGWGFDPQTMLADWTPAVAEMYGLSPESPPPMEQALDFFSLEQRPALEAALAAAVKDGVPHDLELLLTAANGEKKWVRTICRPIVENGKVVRVRGSLQDITARRYLEEQFRQSQKMEAIGRLAGGVAHDFNNLLTIINVYTELLLAATPPDTPSRSSLTAIHDAGNRAANLTQQLLAFSRKSVVEPKCVAIKDLVAESASLFRRLIGENISLSVVADSDPLHVLIDPGQLEQVLMNLVVNARDSMPTGGKLTIEVHALEVGDIGDASHPELLPGRYALLSVIDTGCGMTAEVKEKMFEPFFTTKGVGKGTGLGLAVVHGLVQQFGGIIDVKSAPNSGSTFHIFFPAAESSSIDRPVAEFGAIPSGGEMLLLVEDEEAVRAVVKMALESHGYSVLTASNGDEAIDMLRVYSKQVDLLVSDVIMPGKSGRELALLARERWPEIRILFMSGYTDDAINRHGLQGLADSFIQKPFTPLGLAQSVREVLDIAK